ncbi:hypothetical protein SAZ11_46290 [Streptomyces sp. FXJ1.4098]|nr:hypothetical protein [Streptomyces sp. FXJ1.4098]
MPIWHDTAKELFHTLHRLRAFRRTRLLGMATDDPHTIRLTVEPFRLGAASATPITGENNLLLVLSDGIGEAWQSGRLNDSSRTGHAAAPSPCCRSFPKTCGPTPVCPPHA